MGGLIHLHLDDPTFSVRILVDHAGVGGKGGVDFRYRAGYGSVQFRHRLDGFDGAEAFAGSLGAQHAGFAVDVTNPGSLKDTRDKILSRYRTIDILVNNAAINDMFENPGMAKELSAFENYPLDAFKKSLDVNVTGVFLASQVFGTVMAGQGNGSIINIASTYGMVGPDQSAHTHVEHGKINGGAVFPCFKYRHYNFPCGFYLVCTHKQRSITFHYIQQ